jgi:hypothetical protein
MNWATPGASCIPAGSPFELENGLERIGEPDWADEFYEMSVEEHAEHRASNRQHSQTTRKETNRAKKSQS